MRVVVRNTALLLRRWLGNWDEETFGLVYGGGNVDLMGILADAVLRAGGEAQGVIPEHDPAYVSVQAAISHQVARITRVARVLCVENPVRFLDNFRMA